DNRRRSKICGRFQLRKRFGEPRIDSGPTPQDPQPADILAIDLIERRVPLVAFVTAEEPPLRGRTLLCADGDWTENCASKEQNTADEAAVLEHRAECYSLRRPIPNP